MPDEQLGIIDLAARYDQFQSEAVANIVEDFKDHSAGRYLLVIPTGGGKTFTAVKAVNKLFHSRVLSPEKDSVVWAAHREELVKQAAKTLAKFSEKYPKESYEDHIHTMMISGVARYIRNNNDVKIVIIDEAHHAATKNIQYGPIFDYPSIGILGLTATPSRHDGQPLEFDKESYSIGFPDLVEKQIILSPEIREIPGGRFEGVTSRGSGFSGLDDLSTPERNEAIIQHIYQNQKLYHKIIIYAGSVEQSKKLFAQILDSDLSEQYESVDYIVGNGWSGNEALREEFVERIKSYKRAIIVNHDVLTEGFDDPSVNTVIMARPSKSKLVYMQAVGRGVRIDPANPAKRAFIVEVSDDLPNIRYRIDNRWLFSEISDTLEPQVTDSFYGSEQEFKDNLESIFADKNVPDRYREIPAWNPRHRYSVLLFRYFAGEDCYEHIPLIIDNDTRSATSNWFNFLSERMEVYRKQGVNPEQAMKMARYEALPGLGDLVKRRLIMDALEAASEQVADADTLSGERDYWVSFVALRFRRKGLSEDIQAFISEMVNREQIETELLERHYTPGSILARFPLPLCRYVGQILTDNEFDQFDLIVSHLNELKEEGGEEDHRIAVRDLLDQSVLPIDMIYRDALTMIVRESEPYFVELE